MELNILRWISSSQSVSFYRDFLGLTVSRQFSPTENIDIVFLKADGPFEIELIEDKQVPIGEIKNHNVSIGIVVKDYDRILNDSRKFGVLKQEPVKLADNLECFFIEDPTGVGIQVIKEKY
ncbi:MAG: hypothetical protein GX963_08340 [Bacteroidales bacterium]|nr:hypothetical protein [Bacteroidales bacterium]